MNISKDRSTLNFFVMAFGQINVEATFQAAMNDLSRSHLQKFVLIFFDNILV